MQPSRKKKILTKLKLTFIPCKKVVLGAAHTAYPGWLSLNQDVCDLTKEKDFQFLFKPSSLENILLEHVIEHLEPEDFSKSLQIMKKFLKPGGRIRIAVPDRFHPSAYVRELTGINGTEPGGDDHKAFYSIEDFIKIAQSHGLSIEPIEYFDKDGIFFSKSFSYDFGYISRCSLNYKGRFTSNESEYNKFINTVPDHLQNQFFEKKFSYTSLLVDFIKT